MYVHLVLFWLVSIQKFFFCFLFLCFRVQFFLFVNILFFNGILSVIMSYYIHREVGGVLIWIGMIALALFSMPIMVTGGYNVSCVHQVHVELHTCCTLFDLHTLKFRIKELCKYQIDVCKGSEIHVSFWRCTQLYTCRSGRAWHKHSWEVVPWAPHFQQYIHVCTIDREIFIVKKILPVA